MPSTAEQLDISPEDYLAGEKLADIRHEYISGEVYAMAGAGDAHVKAALNIASLLKNHTRGSGCSTYMSDMKVKVADDEAFFYPDVMVCCEDSDKQQNYVKQHPLIIIEVLSSSTEAFDRGKKFAYYRKINSLREYVLINPKQYQVDIFRLNDKARWELFSLNDAKAIFTLESLGFECDVQDIYDDIDFTATYID